MFATWQAPPDVQAKKPQEWVAGQNVGMTLPALKRSEFEVFFNGNPESPEKVIVASLSDTEQQLFGVKSKELWLSRTTLDEHRHKHPEITVDDNMVIPEIIRRGAVWGGHFDRRFLLLMIGNRPYRAAIKASQDHETAWFLSLVVSGKQKPPKGAVLLREAAGDPGWRP